MTEKHIDEHEAMRNEISQRSSFQQKYIILNLIITGGIISYVTIHMNSCVFALNALLIQPLMSFCLFMLWFHHALVISHRGKYIEKKLLPNGWEKGKFDYFTNKGKFLMKASFVAGLIVPFIGTSILSLFIYVTQAVKPDGLESTLLVIDALVILISIYCFTEWFIDFYCKKHSLVSDEEKLVNK